MHKGFKCLDISTGRIYISRDILFDEFIFPFTALHSMVGARYRSDVLLSPTIDLGDNNFANMANVHALPLLSVVDCCPLRWHLLVLLIRLDCLTPDPVRQSLMISTLQRLGLL
jgi:hypothetical protein